MNINDGRNKPNCELRHRASRAGVGVRAKEGNRGK